MQNILKPLVAVLAVLIFARIIAGPPKPKGLIVMTNLKLRQLETAAFQVDAPTAVRVDATGSTDERDGASGLATSVWILNTRDRTVVWDMEQRPLVEGRGTLRHVKADTFILDPGRYEAYFASYGQLVHRSDRTLGRDQKAWRFVLRTVGRNASAHKIHHKHTVVDPAVVWDATKLGNSERREYLFEVTQSVTVTVSATGEVRPNERMDHSWIARAVNGQRVWSLTAERSEPAGGAASNRRSTAVLELSPGIYRAAAETDRSHAYGAWRGNPPHDPDAWGMKISAADPTAVKPFDPWQSREPIISFVRVGNDKNLSQRFEVAEPAAVVIWGMGEIIGNPEHAWDFAQLDQESPRHQELWKMTLANSKHAGGGRKNRYELKFLWLNPGVYTLRYESDDSHAWRSWNADEPDFPERWGVTMFPVSSLLPDGAVTLLDNDTRLSRSSEAPPSPGSPGAAAQGESARDGWRP